MNTFSEYITESVKTPKKLPGAPLQFADFRKQADSIAKKLKCGLDAYPKNEHKWIEQQRDRYLQIIWNSCLMELKPQGFDAKFVDSTIYGNTRPFFADEIRVEEWSPMKWRKAVSEWLVSAISKNEKKWVASRFDITVKDGQKYVARKW